MRALDRPGVWLRAGMGGMITGLDLNQAMATLHHDCDGELSRQLFMIAEMAFCAAVARRDKEEAG